jgi:polar amino acid transport system substrate-binding protein
MNAERAKALQYSKPYAANQMFLLGKKTAKLDTPATLKGMPVGVPKGSSQESLVAKMAPDAQLRRFDDDSSTIQALLSGQVDAVGANQFYIGRINEQKPGIFENKFPLATNYNGAGTRLGDKAWNSTVNSFIDKMKASGKLNEFYKKWMGFAAPDFATSLEGVPFSVQ